MKNIAFILLMSFSLSSIAAGSHYKIRVDGLACPYCAYGIEKKLKKIPGLSNIKVDLKKGLVSVDVKEGVALSEKQMRTLFKDAGFTYRSMKQTTL